MTIQNTSEVKIANLPIDLLWKSAGQHAIISIADSSGAIVYANELFSKISGYSNEELVGSTHRIVKSATHPDSFYTDIWQTISAGGVWEGEICNRHKSGHHYWVWSTIVPILDANGLPTHYAGFRTDISHEKRQLEAMQRLEKSEAELLRLAPFGIARLRQRLIVKANDEFHYMLGYSPGELIGKATQSIYHSDEQYVAIGKKAYEPLARGEHVKYEDELRRKDGSSLHVIAGTCSLSREAPTSDTLYIIQDISPHKELEAELAKAVRRNEALSKSKSEFLAIVTHELKTPLHGILGPAQLLELTADTAELALVQELQSSTKRLMRIINEVIEYTSYDLHEGCDGEATNLSTLLFVTAEKYQLNARQNDVDFKIVLADALDADCFVDSKSCSKIVSILLDNAVKYTNRGQIRFEAAIVNSAAGQAVLNIDISDTGIGMSDRILGSLFVPFQQNEKPLDRRYEGLGLGLSLAKKLIDRLDGSIDISSAAKQGTTVRVALPIHR